MPKCHTKNSYHLCSSVKLNTGQGCYNGKVYVSDLSDILLVAVRLEAQKVLDLHENQKCQHQHRNNQKHQHQKRTNANDPSERDVISSKLKKLAANATLLEQHGISLYEEFADGKVDRDAYVAAKTMNSIDLEAIQSRIAELGQRFSEIDANNNAQPSIADESILHRVLITTEVTTEVMSLVDRIIVYDNEHIEVQFAFGGCPK